jgi:hypothetical protein
MYELSKRRLDTHDEAAEAAMLARVAPFAARLRGEPDDFSDLV